MPKIEGGCALVNNTSLQFMGEYLHAFEDTFAHRKADNTPFDAVMQNPANGSEWGIGHGLSGHSPDFTYNSFGCGVISNCWFPVTNWNTNESRTLEMEKETYNKITGYMTAMNFSSQPSHLGKKVDINDPIVAKALVDFNGTHANEEANSGQMGAKIQILNDALAKLGYSQKLVWADNGLAAGTDGYNKDTAYQKRVKNLDGLDPKDYPNAILKTNEAPK